MVAVDEPVAESVKPEETAEPVEEKKDETEVAKPSEEVGRPGEEEIVPVEVHRAEEEVKVESAVPVETKAFEEEIIDEPKGEEFALVEEVGENKLPSSKAVEEDNKV